MAALLACGQGAVLSHRSAASVWKLLPYPTTEPVRVTVPPERRIARPQIVVHSSRLGAGDVRRRHGLPVTSPPRTILDLAAESGGDASKRLSDLERLVAEANYRRIASEAELRQQLEQSPGRPGAAALRAILDLPSVPRRTRGRAAKWSSTRRTGPSGAKMAR